ncbi:MAG: glycosyltransferase family 2 protein [Eubacterium sp.]
MKLSFVCPCYNEEQNVEPFLRLIFESFPVIEDYEVIFINDGSTDGTLNKLKELKKRCSQNIKIINFSRNFGKEAAMYAGLEHACGEYTAIIDTDLQQQPSVVKEMVKALDDNSEVDCVCACQQNRRESAFAKICKKAFYKIADKFTNAQFVDGASDFRVFRSSVREAIVSMSESYRFSKGLFGWVGFNTMYIPYTAEERQNGKSSFGFFKLLRYGLNGIIAFSTAPLKFSLGVGSAAIVFSILYAIITVIRKLVSDINVDGFTQLVIIITFLGGIQLFTIGIIGEYLAKNYIETKRRPIYIAKEIIDYK